MKKYLWVVALVVGSLFAGQVAADNWHAQQDQAFLRQLSQQAQPVPAPMSSMLAESPSPLAPPALFCSGFYCTSDLDCWAHCPGGEGSSYCNRAQHDCYPF